MLFTTELHQLVLLTLFGVFLKGIVPYSRDEQGAARLAGVAPIAAVLVV